MISTEKGSLTLLAAKVARSALLGGTCLAALATVPAVAQDSGMVETVVVTGIIGSLQRDLNIKRDAVGVVDAITAEDIGKFPDVNVADSMMRIPGVTVTRGRSPSMGGGTGGTSTSGDASEITVRGFGPTFNETLFDGRKVATGSTDRAFDFSTVSSDFVSQIDVLKSPDASMSAGAIGATVNVKFPKPFDHPGLVVAGSFSGTVSPERGSFGPNGDILISDTFANDTIGILVDASYSDTQTRQNHINIQGWEGKNVVDPATDPFHSQFWQSQFAGTPPALGSPVWFIQDYGIYHELENNERKQARLVLQWRPTDNIQVTLNDNYSSDNDHQAQYGFSVWFNNGSMQDIQTDKNGTIVNFVQASTPTDFQGAYNPQKLEFNDTGVNVTWQMGDKFSLMFDADHAEGWFNPGGGQSSGQTQIDVDVGYGNAMDNTSIGIAIPGGHGLPYPTGYGPNGDKSQFINNGIIGSHVIPLTTGVNVDEVTQAKAEGDWNGDNLDVKFGFQYVAEHKNESQYSDFENNNWQAYSGYGPASGNAQGVALPQSYYTKSFSTANFISGWTGSSNLPPAILQYDPWPTLNYLNGLHGAGANNCCAPPPNEPGRPFSGTYQTAFNPGAYNILEEKTYSGYVQGTVKTTLDTMPLRINFGARYDITEENVSALGRTPVSFTQQTGDATAWAVNYANGGALSLITSSNQYQYLLPNLDLTLSVLDDLDVRFDVSRTLTRPPIANLSPVFTIGASRVGDVTESGGNPDLLPFLSDNVDLGAQWYYAGNSYLSADVFVKAVDNFITQAATGKDFGNVGTECTNPATKVPYPACITVDVPYTVTQPVNNKAANVYGIELAWQHVFGDSGFGYLVNGTIVGTNKPYNPLDLSISGFSVTGLADSMNAMVFYDKDGFQARLAANWQDSVLEFYGQIQNGSNFGTEPTFVNGSWNLDFSTSYDITDQITAYAEAMNLTDASYSTHGRYSNQVLDVVNYGRKFIIGVHFKM